ncbi:MAG: branched-chain amino acid ABC transporter permease [Desulfobacterales bacterium]|jgi:branched-chain amino acid transport system permease protein|nr:branched-chain amino acid ABC transporter permease [Desulfobacterales bacterium]MDP6681834.1 branched-chain amino acid ABC transporter permease [Desulfobacterales bacterium]MDP6808536.1 branched-chain amino acid ABC transporter permease [Desulfobacterales bacterium]|tara:strand:- start:27972 stop:28955 length:984 start_codon:yes stop_codon:yes gene_type:complete
MQGLNKGKVLSWTGVLIIIALLPFILSKYTVFLLSLLAVYALVALGLNLLMGYTGQIAAGHAGFLALGAYFTAIVGTQVEWMPCLVIILMAGIFTGIVGFLLGIPILRLKGFYIAMATLAFGVVVSEIILQWSSLTNGDDGFQVPIARIAGFSFDSDFKLYYLIIFVTIILTLFAKNLANGYIGRAFIALKESETAAQTIGIDLAKYKTIAFAISAFYTGIAGGLFAYLITYLSPDAFTIELSIDFIAMIVIGGMGSILGSIIGAVILTGMQQVLAGLQNLQILIFGFSLIIFTIFMPRGISGMLNTLLERLSLAMRSKNKELAQES